MSCLKTIWKEGQNCSNSNCYISGTNCNFCMRFSALRSWKQCKIKLQWRNRNINLCQLNFKEKPICRGLRITKGNNSIKELAPSPYFYYKSSSCGCQCVCQILWNSVIAFSRYWKTKTSRTNAQENNMKTVYPPCVCVCVCGGGGEGGGITMKVANKMVLIRLRISRLTSAFVFNIWH